MTKIDALTKTLLYEKVAVIHAAFEDAPTTVAFVEVKKDATINEKLEEAFMKTNSIDDGWWRNEGVDYIAPEKTCRSTSMGDMVLIGNTKYKCEMAGWSEV